MNAESLRRLIPVPDEKTRIGDRKLILILALLMIVSGISVGTQVVYMYWDVGMDTYGKPLSALAFVTFGNIDNIIFIITGLIIYLKRETAAVNKVAGAAAVVLGIHLTSIAAIDSDATLLEYYIQVTSDLLAFGLLIFGVLLYLGRSKYARALGYISMFYVGYEVITYRYNLIYLIDGTDILMFLLPFLPYTAMMLTFTALMFRPSVMPPTLLKRMTESGTRIIDTSYTDPDVYIVRSDLKEMCGLFDAPAENDDGIIDIERRYRLLTPLHTRMLTVRRLPGEDFLRASVGSEDGSFCGYRFSVRQIIPDTGSADDCGRITVYGDSGMLVFITVRDSELSFQELSALELREERALRPD